MSLFKKEGKVNAWSVVKLLNRLKEENGDQGVLIETPQGSAYVKLKDAIIYEGCCGEIVLDSE